jgi:hypothetical protein
MPCQEWFELVERYRAAVHSYGDAVDRFRSESSSDLEAAWQHTEQARKAADRARGALLVHERSHTCLAARAAAARGWSYDAPTEDMILGDQGQSGG